MSQSNGLHFQYSYFSYLEITNLLFLLYTDNPEDSNWGKCQPLEKLAHTLPIQTGKNIYSHEGVRAIVASPDARSIGTCWIILVFRVAVKHFFYFCRTRVSSILEPQDFN